MLSIIKCWRPALDLKSNGPCFLIYHSSLTGIPLTISSLDLGQEDFGSRKPGSGCPSGPLLIDSELFLKLLACSFLKNSLQWKFLPLEIFVNLIAIEMHKWDDKSCILSAIIAIFFYLLESDLCSVDELHFFKVYFPVSKVRLFIKWLAQNVILPSPVLFFHSYFKNVSHVWRNWLGIYEARTCVYYYIFYKVL